MAPMKIVVFGGTGGTGKHVITHALAAGHDVVAVARKPEAVASTHERLRVERGDVLEQASFAGALAGADAVISAIGPASNRKPGTLLSHGVRNMLAGCAAAGVPRFILESGLMASDGKELAVGHRFMVKLFGLVLAALHEEKLASEASVRASPLEWVIVRPPNLDHAPASGSYRVGPAMRINPTKALAHGDVAGFLVQVASDHRWDRQIVNIGH